MLTRNKELQHIADKYREAGQPWPAATRDIAAWAIREDLWTPSRTDLLNQCADQLARAMREEYITDAQGRSVRAKHVAKSWRNGELIGLWDDIRTADRQHMAIAFQQRRQQIVGDCRQLKTDVDSYNENRNDGVPINLVLDFTQDVEELEATKKPPDVAEELLNVA
ncbi:MAG TPA: hypothetical protein VMX94_02810 [Armatimonadota bacterium]|nr:hypothetical protein [Armatimonadota bacterium]